MAIEKCRICDGKGFRVFTIFGVTATHPCRYCDATGSVLTKDNDIPPTVNAPTEGVDNVDSNK